MKITELECEKILTKIVRKHSKSAGVIWMPVDLIGREVDIIIKPRSRGVQ